MNNYIIVFDNQTVYAILQASGEIMTNYQYMVTNLINANHILTQAGINTEKISDYITANPGAVEPL